MVELVGVAALVMIGSVLIEHALSHRASRGERQASAER